MELVRRLTVLLVWTLQGPFRAIYLDEMLVANERFGSRRKRILLWTAVEFVISGMPAFLTQSGWQVVQLAVMVIVPIILLRCCYLGRFVVRLAAFVLLFAVQIMLDIVFTYVNIVLVGMVPAASRATMSAPFVVNVVAMQILTIAFQGMVCNLWSRRRKERGSIRYTASLLVFALIGICIFLAGIYVDNNPVYIYDEIFMAINICIFFTICGAVLVSLNQAEKDAIGKELAEIRRISELERTHYASLEARREELARIRHDYQNVINSVSHLLHAGAVREAEEVLTELSSRVAETRETPFCTIPVINAVLTEKQQQCRENDIIFQTDLLLPASLAIENLDLCSAFSNLMDNAIRACIPIPDSKITLSCRAVQGYLVIKCVNPSNHAPGGKPEGTGYGLKILKDIASRYRGDFFTEYKNGVFTAQLSLMDMSGQN